MALDYLPIMASSVPCERVFSSSGETDTKKRNRMGAVLMEALQIAKYLLKEERLDFMEGWITSEGAMTEIDSERDVLDQVATSTGNATATNALMAFFEEE